jgi:hypothetical protein
MTGQKTKPAYQSTDAWNLVPDNASSGEAGRVHARRREMVGGFPYDIKVHEVVTNRHEDACTGLPGMSRLAILLPGLVLSACASFSARIDDRTQIEIAA